MWWDSQGFKPDNSALWREPCLTLHVEFGIFTSFVCSCTEDTKHQPPPFADSVSPLPYYFACALNAAQHFVYIWH